MPKEEIEYMIDQDITIAPAEDIPLDGRGLIQNFEEYHKKNKKPFKKKGVSKATTKTMAKESNEEKVKETEKPKPKIVSKPKISKKVKDTKKQSQIKPKKSVKSSNNINKEVKMENPDIKPVKVEIKEPVETTEEKMPEKDDLPNYEEQISGAKYFIFTVIAIVMIILIIFGIRYCGGKEEVIQIQSPSGTMVNIIASSQYSYNGYNFAQGNDGLWYTNVKVDEGTEYYVRLHHGPVELENIPIEGDVDESFKNVDKIYLTFNPTGKYLNYITLSTGEIGTNLAKAFQIGLEGACTVNETSACETRPIITCENTDSPVIQFVESETAKVELSGNCILIKGQEEDIVKASERLIYFLYGVMSN